MCGEQPGSLSILWPGRGTRVDMQSVDHGSVGDHRMVRFAWRVIRPVARTRLSWTPIRGGPRGSRPSSLGCRARAIANHLLINGADSRLLGLTTGTSRRLLPGRPCLNPTGWTVFSGLRGWCPQGRRGSSPLSDTHLAAAQWPSPGGYLALTRLCRDGRGRASSPRCGESRGHLGGWGRARGPRRGWRQRNAPIAVLSCPDLH